MQKQKNSKLIQLSLPEDIDHVIRHVQIDTNQNTKKETITFILRNSEYYKKYRGAKNDKGDFQH